MMPWVRALNSPNSTSLLISFIVAEVSGQTVKVKKEKTVNIDMELELTGDSTRMDEDEMANWVIDTQFQKDQTRLKIPEDPVQWTQMQVKYWLQWAIKQFQLVKSTLFYIL